MHKLSKIMYPSGVAIIGASQKEGSVGSELLKRILEFNYKGKVFPVNPSYTKLYNLNCYNSVSDIAEKVDLAIIAVPAKFVSNVIDECYQAKIFDAVIISSGFKEVGGNGVLLEDELNEKIKKYNMNVVGPNCLGVFNSAKDLNFDGCFAPLVPEAGSIGFATQSGALATGVFNISSSLRIGFGQMISLGNQMDIGAIDVLEFWEKDDNISQIILYLEAISQPKKFRKVATRVARKKPVIVMKSGRSEAGAQAAASHTGSLAGSDNATSALLSSCGVIRELELRNVFNNAQVLSSCPLPKGNRLGILTNAGGPGILATDAANDMNIEVPTFSDKMQQKLKNITLPQASCKNPVDLVASASREHYAHSAEVLLKSDEIDMLLVIYLYIAGKNDMHILSDLDNLQKKYPNKPIVTVYMTTPDFKDRVATNLPNSNIPIFEFVDDAVGGFNRLIERKNFLNDIKQKTKSYNVKITDVQDIINNVRLEKRTLLTTKESLEVFKAYSLKVPKSENALTLKEAISAAKKVGYPLVLKMSSKEVSHKTDIGGVVVGINDAKSLKREWVALEQRLKKANVWDTLDSVIVMQHIKSSREFVAGVVDNGDFGHQIMFGIGGIFIEALKEVAFAPCPLNMRDVNNLIYKTKAKNLLGEVRGKGAANIDDLRENLLRLSQLVVDFPQIKEIDANPFMLDDKGNLFAVDSRIILKAD